MAWGRIRGIPFRTLVSVPRSILPLVAFSVIWIGYVVWIGGDIMEFRQLVPVIPLLLLLLTELLRRVAPDFRSAVLVALLVFGGSLTHGLFFQRYVRPIGIGAIPVLRELGCYAPETNWKVMGTRLGDAFHTSRDVTIAVSPAGAIPFFSRARTIDMIGLNDLWVPRHGFERRTCKVCSAHLRYLMDSGVNLIIGHPQLVSWGQPPASAAKVVENSFYDEEMDYDNLPDDARLLRIPLEGDVALAATYTKRDPRIERLVAEGVWRAQPILQEQFAGAPVNPASGNEPAARTPD
jgi:arabinofuranosyltransferase